MPRLLKHPEAVKLLRRLRETDDPREAAAVKDEAARWLLGEHRDLTPEAEMDFAAVWLDARQDAHGPTHGVIRRADLTETRIKEQEEIWRA